MKSNYWFKYLILLLASSAFCQDDIFRYQAGTCGAEVFLSDGITFTNSGCWTNVGVDFANRGWHIGDFNGDGYDDIFRYQEGTCGSEMFLSDGITFTNSGCWTNSGVSFNNGGWFIGDFNGVAIVDNDQDGFSEDEDCDDSNASINPGQMEEPYNGLDDDCDLTTLDDDLDQDGFGIAEDCDDTNALINPLLDDIPDNGIDEDCDGEDAMTTSTYEFGPATLNIYPNPVSSFINIEISGNLSFETTLTDLGGGLIHKSENKNQVDISQFVDGIYLLTITEMKSKSQITERIKIVK